MWSRCWSRYSRRCLRGVWVWRWVMWFSCLGVTGQRWVAGWILWFYSSLPTPMMPCFRAPAAPAGPQILPGSRGPATPHGTRRPPALAPPLSRGAALRQSAAPSPPARLPRPPLPARRGCVGPPETGRLARAAESSRERRGPPPPPPPALPPPPPRRGRIRVCRAVGGEGRKGTRAREGREGKEGKGGRPALRSERCLSAIAAEAEGSAASGARGPRRRLSRPARPGRPGPRALRAPPGAALAAKVASGLPRPRSRVHRPAARPPALPPRAGGAAGPEDVEPEQGDGQPEGHQDADPRLPREYRARAGPSGLRRPRRPVGRAVRRGRGQRGELELSAGLGTPGPARPRGERAEGAPRGSGAARRVGGGGTGPCDYRLPHQTNQLWKSTDGSGEGGSGHRFLCFQGKGLKEAAEGYALSSTKLVSPGRWGGEYLFMSSAEFPLAEFISPLRRGGSKSYDYKI